MALLLVLGALVFIDACADLRQGTEKSNPIGGIATSPRQAGPADWCQNFTPGPGTSLPAELSLSKAHAARRFFGVGGTYSPADQALARALQNQKVTNDLDLEPYARSLPDTCWLTAVSRGLPRLRVRIKKGVAWISPGRGAFHISGNVQSIVLDFRDLPNTKDVREALASLVSSILPDPIPIPDWASRSHHGMTDEYFLPHNVYSNAIEITHSAPLAARGGFRGPLYVLIGSRLPPDAAELAGALRLGRRARLVGEPVKTAVAESIWIPQGKKGLAFRIRDLQWDSRRWPDVIPADLSLEEMNRILNQGTVEEIPSVPLSQESNRLALAEVHPFRDVQPPAFGIGDVRAALVIAYGALRLFFPDFQELGDRIDPRLREVLAGTDESPGIAVQEEERRLLRRLSEALHDGHSFVFSTPGDPEVKGFADLVVETLNGTLVVRRSGVTGVEPGDTVLSIDGKPISRLYAELLPLTSASSIGYRYSIANRDLIRLKAPAEFEVKAPHAALSRRVRVVPVPFQTLMLLNPGTAVMRKNGWLTDLGASDVYYLNLSKPITKDLDTLNRSIREAAKSPGARKLVVDMRGYPGVDVYEIARRFICRKFSSPVFRYYSYASPDSRTVTESSNTYDPLPDGPSYCGPISLIIGHDTVSAAETLATVLTDAKRVRVFGQSPSAGSNGNIPGIQLPGGFALTFSGMEVLHADRSPFAGIGIVPDVLVPVTADDLARGEDPELKAAAGSGG
jgi:hypothetical protein